MNERAVELMGLLTMAWSPKPVGNFDSEEAIGLINEAFALVWEDGFNTAKDEWISHKAKANDFNPYIEGK